MSENYGFPFKLQNKYNIFNLFETFGLKNIFKKTKLKKNNSLKLSNYNQIIESNDDDFNSTKIISGFKKGHITTMYNSEPWIRITCIQSNMEQLPLK